MKNSEIVSLLPYTSPFLFVDEIDRVSQDGIEGNFTFKKEMVFFQGHFIDHPVTPGVILTECCAQIGLVCLGIYLNSEISIQRKRPVLAMTSADMEYFLPVYPGEKVVVRSKKIYFRFNKLKCKVAMYNASDELVCKGILAGMVKIKRDV